MGSIERGLVMPSKATRKEKKAAKRKKYEGYHDTVIEEATEAIRGIVYKSYKITGDTGRMKVNGMKTGVRIKMRITDTNGNSIEVTERPNTLIGLFDDTGTKLREYFRNAIASVRPSFLLKQYRPSTAS